MKVASILSLVAGVATATNVNIALMQRLTDLREPENYQVLGDAWRTVAIGSVMGVKDWNERNPRYAPEIANFTSCDVQLVPTMYDTGSNARGSIIAYRQARADATAGGYDLHGIVGAARSDASKPMATLAGIDGIPQVSYWSTSDAFDQQHSTYPYFARTIPADSAVAKAAAQLFHSYGHKYVGIAFVQDSYGEAYKDAFVKYCSEVNIDVSTQGFIGGDEEGTMLKEAIDAFALEGLRVGIAIIFGNDFDRFFEYATEKGLCGPGTLWILSEATSNDEVQAKTGILQDAANGMGRILSQGGVPGAAHYDAFAADWVTFDADSDLVAYIENLFFDYTADSSSTQPEGTDLSVLPTDFFANQAPDDVATYAYDAAVTLGMAACNYIEEGGTFDADYNVGAYYEHIKSVAFSSISGDITFDGTGSRTASTGNYMLYNFREEDGVTNVYTSGSWTEAGGWSFTTDNFRFSDDTDVPPMDVEVPDHEKNFLDKSLVAVGNTLVFLNYFIAFSLGCLVYSKRKHKVIRASQPMFLYMVLLGCCVSTSTILFLGIDDNQEGMSEEDAIKAASDACMMGPIFYSLGFIFSFAALFAKITRIAKIFGNKKLQRVTITIADMMKPIVALLVVDAMLLALWSSDDESALKWDRVVEFELKGYPVESSGICSSENPWKYLIFIVILHLFVLMYGNYMCYKARNAGTAFSESKYVFIAMASNLQILALGLPILIIVYDQPVTNYFVRSGIIFLNDFGVMCLIFLPKLQLVFFGSEEDLALATSTQTKGNTQTGSGSNTSDGN